MNVYNRCRSEQPQVASNCLYEAHEIEIRQPVRCSIGVKEALQMSSSIFSWSWLLLKSARALGSNFLSNGRCKLGPTWLASIRNHLGSPSDVRALNFSTLLGHMPFVL
jgi:hypothetical protein